MYSRRGSERSGVLLGQSREELGEIGSRVAPLERLGEDLVVGLEGEDARLELVERGGIGRCEDLALQDAEVDLD